MIFIIIKREGLEKHKASLITSTIDKMYAMYVDETGLKGYYTILSGVIIHEKYYRTLCSEVENLLFNCFDTNQVLLKEIRRKTYSEGKFDTKQYFKFETEYYNLLSTKNPIFIVSAVKNDWSTDEYRVLEKAYEHLLERFHLFLKIKEIKRTDKLFMTKVRDILGL